MQKVRQFPLAAFILLFQVLFTPASFQPPPAPLLVGVGLGYLGSFQFSLAVLIRYQSLKDIF